MNKQIKKETTTGLLEINISTDKHFSITADFFENRPDGNKSPRRWTSGGCLHDEILAACPELKPLVDLHVSDLEGVPMYSFENGFYWLGGAASFPLKYGPDFNPEECFEILCGHLRVSDREASEILGKVVNAFIDGKAKIATSEEVTEKCKEMQEAQGLFDAKVSFKKEVDKLLPRWKNEAAQAIELLESL